MRNNKVKRARYGYIAILEKTNEELVKTLKQCVELLDQFKTSVPDPIGRLEMLDQFHETIGVAEKTVENKSLH